MPDADPPKHRGRTPITPLRLTEADLAELDELVKLLKLASRAEAVREAVKNTLADYRQESP